MTNPPLLEGASQLSDTCALTPVACRFCGAEGGAGGIALASFDLGDSPTEFRAVTW